MKRIGIMPIRFIFKGGETTIEAKAYTVEDNTVSVNLITKETEKGRLNLPFNTIEACAEILANNLLDYAKSGGDMANLTPSKVFGKKIKK